MTDPETQAAIDYLERACANESRLLTPVMLNAIKRLITVAHHMEHSEMFVVMFLGYLIAKIPVLNCVTKAHMLKVWENFKTEMGKKP